MHGEATQVLLLEMTYSAYFFKGTAGCWVGAGLVGTGMYVAVKQAVSG